MYKCSNCGKSFKSGAIGKEPNLYCSDSCERAAAEARYQTESVPQWKTDEALESSNLGGEWLVRAQSKEFTGSFEKVKQWLIEGRISHTDLVRKGSLPWVRIQDCPPLNGLRLWGLLDAAQREYVSKFRPGLVTPGAVAPTQQNAAIPSGALSCPRCGGAATGGRGCVLIACAILLFPIGLLLLLIKPTYSCTSCGFTFRS